MHCGPGVRAPDAHVPALTEPHEQEALGGLPGGLGLLGIHGNSQWSLCEIGCPCGKHYKRQDVHLENAALAWVLQRSDEPAMPWPSKSDFSLALGHCFEEQYCDEGHSPELGSWLCQLCGLCVSAYSSVEWG